jgi:hypothetical protein
MLQAFIVLPVSELLQISMIVERIQGLFTAQTPREKADRDRPPAPNYGWLYPMPLLLFVIAVTFSVTAPLILPVAAAFFLIGKLVYSYQFVRVYQPRYESGGRAWPYLFRRIMAGLILFQLSTAGLLLLKGMRIYSVMALPSIVGTLLFASYCINVYESQSYYLSLDVASGIAREEEDSHLIDEKDEIDEASTSSVYEFQPNESTGTGFDTMWRRVPNDQPSTPRTNIIGSLRHHLRPEKLKKAVDTFASSAASLGNGIAQVFTNNEDDEPEKQGFMTYIDGVLDTNVPTYEHLAVKGNLPRLWPPPGFYATRRRGVRSYFSL